MQAQTLNNPVQIEYVGALLKISALFMLVYFTASHWFFHTSFFNILGIEGADLRSPFLITQLQLIGGQVAGFALLCIMIARDLNRLQGILNVILIVGTVAEFIFIVDVFLGMIPVNFLMNALFLGAFTIPVLIMKSKIKKPEAKTPDEQDFAKKTRPLSALLIATGSFLLIFETASHWFFQKFFYETLGFQGVELDSSFIVNQLHLSGSLTLGYALISFIIAKNPGRFKDVLKVVIAVGAISAALILNGVFVGAMPPLFLFYAGLLIVQISIISMLFFRQTMHAALEYK